MKSFKISILTFLLIAGTGLFAQDWRNDLSKENPQLATALNRFMEANTQEARNFLPKFSDSELELIWSYYKSSKPKVEQRYFWLVEEHESRKADRIASERLKYAFWAIFLLILLLLMYTVRIYKLQQAVARHLE